MKEILNYLSKNYSKIKKDAENYIIHKCDEISMSKGEILLKEGEICRHVWFIKKGLLRAYQHNHPQGKKPEKIFNNWFMQEWDTATSVISFFKEIPSEEEIVAEEDVILFRMSKEDLFAGLNKYPDMAILTLLIVVKYYCETRHNETYLRMKEPHFIHERMLAECPELLQRVDEKDMATFLGVTGPTYGKIKSGKYRQTEKAGKGKSKTPAKKK